MNGIEKKSDLISIYELYMAQPTIHGNRRSKGSFETFFYRFLNLDDCDTIDMNTRVHLRVAQVINDYYASHSISTRKVLISTMSTYLDFAGYNSAALKKLNSKYKVPRRYYSEKAISEEELKTIFKYSKECHIRKSQDHAKFFIARNRAILMVLLVTAVRRDQLRTLKCSDISHDSSGIYITITRQKSFDKTKRKKFLPMGAILPDGSTVREVYYEYLFNEKRRLGQYFFYGDDPDQPMAATTLYQIIDRLGNHPHAFRHTSATRVAQVTGSVIAVGELLDHASLTVSQRYISETKDNRINAIKVWLGSPDRVSGQKPPSELGRRAISRRELRGVSEEPVEKSSFRP